MAIATNPHRVMSAVNPPTSSATQPVTAQPLLGKHRLDTNQRVTAPLGNARQLPTNKGNYILREFEFDMRSRAIVLKADPKGIKGVLARARRGLGFGKAKMAFRAAQSFTQALRQAAKGAGDSTFRTTMAALASQTQKGVTQGTLRQVNAQLMDQAAASKSGKTEATIAKLFASRQGDNLWAGMANALGVDPQNKAIQKYFTQSLPVAFARNFAHKNIANYGERLNNVRNLPQEFKQDLLATAKAILMAKTSDPKQAAEDLEARIGLYNNAQKLVDALSNGFRQTPAPWILKELVSHTDAIAKQDPMFDGIATMSQRHQRVAELLFGGENKASQSVKTETYAGLLTKMPELVESFKNPPPAKPPSEPKGFWAKATSWVNWAVGNKPATPVVERPTTEQTQLAKLLLTHLAGRVTTDQQQLGSAISTIEQEFTE